MPTLAETVQQSIIPQLGGTSPLQSPTLGTASQLVNGDPAAQALASQYAALLAQGVNPANASALSGAGQQLLTGGPSALSQEAANSLRAFTTQDLGNSPATQAAVAAFNQNTLPLIQQQLALQGLGGGPAVADVSARALATALPGVIQNDLANRLAATGQLAGLEQLNQSGQQLGGNFLTALEQLNQSGLQAGLSGNLQQQGIRQSGQQLGLQGLLSQQNLNQSGLQSAGQLAQGEEQLNQSAANLQAQIADQEANRQLQAQQNSLNALLGFGSQILSPAAQLDQSQLQTGLGFLGEAGALQRSPTQEQIANEELDFLRQQGLAEQGSFGVFGGSVIPPTVQQSGRSTTTSSGGK